MKKADIHHKAGKLNKAHTEGTSSDSLNKAS